MSFSYAKASAGLVLFSAFLLVGCSGMASKGDNISEGPDANLKPVPQEVDPVAPMVLRVVGYGAVDYNSKNHSAAQRKLLAVRASKMDAYRALAERVYGMSVRGNTTVRDMIVQDDRFRSYVETYMHGARVLSADVLADGTVETTLEMAIDHGFRNCLQTTDSKRINVDCRAPLAASNAGGYASKQRQRVSSEAGMPASGFYFID